METFTVYLFVIFLFPFLNKGEPKRDPRQESSTHISTSSTVAQSKNTKRHLQHATQTNSKMRICPTCDGVIPPSPGEILQEVGQSFFGSPSRAALTVGSALLLANPLALVGFGVAGPIAGMKQPDPPQDF